MSNFLLNQIKRNITEYNILKNIKNLFRLKKDNGIKNKIIKVIRTLLESAEENYYEPVRESWIMQ